MTYKPDGHYPVPLYILRPIKKVDDLGKIRIIYETPAEAMDIKNRKFFGVMKTYQGTKTTIDSQTVWEDTAEISTPYNPIIEHGCRIYHPVTKKIYEVINEPENVQMMGIYTVFTVKRVISHV